MQVGGEVCVFRMDCVRCVWCAGWTVCVVCRVEARLCVCRVFCVCRVDWSTNNS